MQLRDKTALQKILEVIKETLNIFGDTSLENFLNNKERQLAMTMAILRIGELVKNLTMEFRDSNPQVKWKPIAGFRDIIAHKYETVDMEEVYNTVKKNFPELKLQIEQILATE
ncbi:MAG: DUF86 domain-containing protein [Selenomonadaceae bacterium]|nr:DUF86 domain-containing protein [Selenomonadaceae bacterium]MBQ7630615.1 DUF86 domain-containing protein [Selenomonadaceae bacterium]